VVRRTRLARRSPPSASRADYEALQTVVGRTAPPGCIVHTASEVDGRVRVVEVWNSQQHIDEFFQSKVGPALQKLAVEIDPPKLTETFSIERC
jgi:quinol monooxygenase YgiN